MKIIHTADWHLGQEFFHYDRKEEHLCFFQQLCRLVKEEQPDALVVCGDIFHSATPSNATTKLYTEQMVALHESCPSMVIVVTAGNHDSCSRLESTGEVWRLANVKVVGGIEREEQTGEIILERHLIELDGKGFIIAVPFISEKNYALFPELLQVVESRNLKALPVVMMGHLAVSGSDFTGHDQPIGGIESEQLSNLGNGYDYLALGHIHCPQTLKESNGHARYCGSPIQVNFDEKNPHSVSIVEVEKHGDAVSIKDFYIHPFQKFYDVPKNALPFDEALEALRQFSPAESGYVRLNVLVKDYAPSDAEARIQEVMALKKNLYFCYIQLKHEITQSATERKIFNTQEIRMMQPIELAKTFYQEKYGTDLEDEMSEMLSEAIQNVTNPDQLSLL